MTVPTRNVGDGGYSALNVTAATQLFTGVGTIYRVVVNVSAANASYVIDSAGTTQAAGNTILTIPASTTAGTVYTLNWPCLTGGAIIPGGTVTLAVSFAQGNEG
jgi:hypothetical protein